jgi:hypothetical protein
MPQDEALGMIEDADLWEVLSPAEREFLLNESPSENDCVKFVWRMESSWVLLWALGYVDRLAWPDCEYDESRILEIGQRLQEDVEEGKVSELRGLSEILDALDLTMRSHWAIRNAYLDGDFMLPRDLDWAGSSDSVPLVICKGTRIVDERHHTLVWLTNALEGIGWDDMDTST